MARKKQEPQVGEQLVKQQVITQEDLDEAHKREEESGTPWYRQLLQSKKLGFDTVNDVLHYEFHLSKSLRDSHMSLGEALVKMGDLTQDRLNQALAEQKRSGKLLGSVLLDKRFVTRETIAIALSKQYGLDYAEAGKFPSEQAAIDRVPESMAKQKEFIPARLEGDKLTVLICGPQAPGRLKDTGIILGVRITPVMTAIEDLSAEIEARYGTRSEQGKTLRRTGGLAARPPMREYAPIHPGTPISQPEDTAGDSVPMQTPDAVESNRFEEIARESQGVPVVKLVSTIIEGAVNSGATDVHLDPQDPEMRVRYRIDGVLHDVMSIPPDIENAVVSRLKILADIDITETRHPQDGHIGMKIGESEFDIRVASLPTYLGERIVLRLLDQSAVLGGISDLGLEANDQKKLVKALDQPYGMVLVTGPTGSGKTTTLYSCLNQKDVMTDSIVTLEDPVEYQLSGINQVQIEPDIELTFANILRAALRQDIDVLLVGEIRDPETARIAIRAAMTGHLVFSTLHTNDAPEAISTLRNMEIPSYLIASALTSIIAQRLVRIICDNCKASFAASKTLLKSVGLPESTKRLYRGKGCEICYHTGTRGRTGIFEVLDITPKLRKMIATDAPIENLVKTAKLKTMAAHCRLKMKQGVVTPEEFLRVIRT